MRETLGKMFGLEGVREIESLDLALAAAWAQQNAFWVVLAALALVPVAVWFYLRRQALGPSWARTTLGVLRGVTLAMILLALADPVLRVTLSHQHPARVFLLFDGTDSMAIHDEYTTEQQEALLTAVGANAAETKPAPGNRLEYVQALLTRRNRNLLDDLRQKHNVEFSAFVFDGQTTSKLRKLELSTQGDDKVDPAHLAQQLTAAGQVTALGTALTDAAAQLGSSNLAGVVMFSDFAQNAGPPPLGDRAVSPLGRLNVPIYTVGIGATEAVDLAVDLQLDPKMKKAERSQIVVKVRQTGLDGRNVQVNLTARKMQGETTDESAEFKVGSKPLTLHSSVNSVEFPYTPDAAGQFEFIATVERLPGEVIEENNRSARDTQVIDDFLRLLYIANEPNWEWRFVKEVFHRDKLVGMDGFRTFLASSDPRVRESNVLFLPSLSPKRSDFFASDVIFLADMPRGTLNERFCDMVKEYVGNLGGGLVVITGPEFGIRDLAGTSLADMLPVRIDPQADVKAAPKFPEFRPRLTSHASRFSFMQLDPDEKKNQQVWQALGKLPWYQPVAAVHEQATVLMEYPAGPNDAAHRCRDGKTPQPLIAIRPYGRGEVVYLAFNEMWRLRRLHGEKYYRAFWSQLIYRLGMSHAMGNEKRFVARIDRPQYRVDEKVLLTVEAYDQNYEPLDEQNLNHNTLGAELITPAVADAPSATRAIKVPVLRSGLFEARIPVVNPGEYTLRVKDPITSQAKELRFDVTSLSAERRKAERDLALQTQLARETQGKSYDLTTVHQLVDDMVVAPKIERQTHHFPLWATPWWFSIVVGLLLVEWLARKWIHLP